ncbi:hypothetical protein QTP86_011131 [Hemibagrus guttatus]|nr:hypothetical protein QTP86_011131 [Hemibagrus guttatus]
MAKPYIQKLQDKIKKTEFDITDGWPPSPKGLNADLLPYYQLRLELSVKDNFVFQGSRLIAPAALRSTLVSIAHEGHQGEPVPLPDGPWQKLAMDIVGSFDTAASDCRFPITLIDYYSKWPEVSFAHTVTTSAVVSFLSSVFSSHGNPLSIVTDNGAQFTSAAFATFLEQRNIRHHRSSLYYPATNGAVERFNRVLKHTIQVAIQQHQPWKPVVTDFLQVYHATPHATTGYPAMKEPEGRGLWQHDSAHSKPWLVCNRLTAGSVMQEEALSDAASQPDGR